MSETEFFCNCKNNHLLATIIFDCVSISSPHIFKSINGRHSLFVDITSLDKEITIMIIMRTRIWMCIKTQFFRFCSHKCTIGETGAASRTDIFNSYVSDGALRAMLAKPAGCY